MMTDDLNQTIGNIQQLEGEKRRALRMLLDEQRRQEGHLLALGARMGEAISYVGSVTLEWVARKVGYASDLPIFSEEDVDKDAKRIRINQTTVGRIQQRRPDWSRQLPMSVYLATRHHKFPPLLVVAYQNWVYDESAEEWGPGGKAMRDSISAIPLDHQGSYFDLDIGEDTHFYALDGQHRLMAIQGLHDIVKKGHLPALTEDRKPKGKQSISLKEVVGFAMKREKEEVDPDVIRNNLLGVMTSERIGIEIIPAVAVGETREESLIRLRSVFVDVNEQARKPTVSESILLDERNGFRITAVRAMVGHNLFRGGEEVVELKKPDIAEGSKYFTSLQAIAEISFLYLNQKEEFSFWRPMGGVVGGYIRPADHELDRAGEVLSAYFTELTRLPSHRKFVEGESAGKIRTEEDNILFRPVAQMALAEACAILERDYGMSMNSIVKELERQEKLDQLKLKNRKAPWFGVLCNPTSEKMRRHKSSQNLCCNMFVFLLGGGYSDGNERDNLRKKFASSRCIEPPRDGRDKGKGLEEAIGLDGNKIAVKDLHLPERWR